MQTQVDYDPNLPGLGNGPNLLEFGDWNRLYTQLTRKSERIKLKKINSRLVRYEGYICQLRKIDHVKYALKIIKSNNTKHYSNNLF